jgi:methylphosphotriester-DNA--protein-cysteine methyltransferase
MQKRHLAAFRGQSRAGFASLRRFNAVFAEIYKRPPSAIRRVRLARA